MMACHYPVHVGPRVLPPSDNPATANPRVCSFFQAVISATQRLLEEALGEVSPRVGMDALHHMRQLVSTDDSQLPETWALLKRKGGAFRQTHG